MLTIQKLFCNSCVYFTRISGDIYCRRWQFALKEDSVACLRDASGKSHYFNGGMKASSKLDF